MRAGPEEIPWHAPGGGSSRPKRPRPPALTLLWLMLLGPVAGVLTGIATALLLAVEPGRQDWAAFGAVSLAALLLSVPLARWLALRFLTGRQGR